MNEPLSAKSTPLLIALRLQYDYIFTNKLRINSAGTHQDAFAILLPANADTSFVVQTIYSKFEERGAYPNERSFDEKLRFDEIEGRRAISLSFRLKPPPFSEIPDILSHVDAANHVCEIAREEAERCAASIGALGILRARDMDQLHTLSIGLARAFERLVATHEEHVLRQATPEASKKSNAHGRLSL